MEKRVGGSAEQALTIQLADGHDSQGRCCSDGVIAALFYLPHANPAMTQLLKSNSPKGKVAAPDMTWTVLVAAVCGGLTTAITELTDREEWWIPFATAGLAGLITFVKRFYTDYQKRNR